MELALATGLDIDAGTAGNQDCGDAETLNSNRTNNPYLQSWCAEVSGLTTPTGVTHNSTFEYDSAKGGMRWTTTPPVKWRLPAIQDYKVADHNGIRFVLPNMATVFWSASVNSITRNNAWLFGGDRGSVNNGSSRSSSSVSGVRCVGGP
jgi:hypothetical protein